MLSEDSKHVDPKLQVKINKLRGYLDPDQPNQDPRYLVRGYTQVQNQARRDVLRVFNTLLTQEAEEIAPSLEHLISLISNVLTRPEQLITDNRTREAFSLVLTSSHFDYMVLAQALINLSGYAEGKILKTYESSEKAVNFEKQLLNLAFSHHEIGNWEEAKFSFESLVRIFRQNYGTEDEQQLQEYMHLLKRVLNTKSSSTDKSDPQALVFQTTSTTLKSLGESIMIFKSILDTHAREELGSLGATEALTDVESDVFSDTEDGLSETPSEEQVQVQEEPPEELIAGNIGISKIYKLKASIVGLMTEKRQIEKKSNRDMLCIHILNKLEQLADHSMQEEPSELFNKGLEEIMGVIKNSSRVSQSTLPTTIHLFTCFQDEAFRDLIPDVLRFRKPPMMASETLMHWIELLNNLNACLDKNPELIVPVNHMKTLAQLAFFHTEGLVQWSFLGEHQKLMKIPWESEQEHPELSVCIEGIQNLYEIPKGRLGHIKRNLCPETFLPERSTQIGIGRDPKIVMSGQLQVLFAYIDNTKNPEKIRTQLKSLAKEFEIILLSGSEKEKEQAYVSISNTEKVLYGKMEVDAYQEHAEHVKNYPSRRMRAVGALMFTLGAIILAVGLTSIVGAVVGGIVGGTAMAAGVDLFIKAKERQSLSKLQGDLGEKLEASEDIKKERTDTNKRL